MEEMDLEQSVKNELENRMDPGDFSISASDLLDVMNEYGVDEHTVVSLYNEIFEELSSDVRDTTKEVLDYFRAKGDYYPSYLEFRKEFNNWDSSFENEDFLRALYKQELHDKNQTSLFEVAKRKIAMMKEDDEFKKAAKQITKDWGGGTGDDDYSIYKQYEKITPEDLFGDESIAAMQDIASEYGEDEIAPFGSMEDADAFVSGLEDLDEADEVEVGQQGLFKPQDANGNNLNLKDLVSNLEGTKKGRLLGFGDDGKGGLIVRVDWQFPTDMKFTNPEEMGNDRVYPDQLVLASSIKESNNTNISEMENNNLNEDFLNELDFISEEDEAALEESGRGLGLGVKNSGDRNVKMRDDHKHAPLTNLNESVDGNIKQLFEGTVTKKGLVDFIKSQAKDISDKI